MFRCFAMVVSSVRVMLGGFLVMFGTFVGHDVSSIGTGETITHPSCCVPAASLVSWLTFARLQRADRQTVGSKTATRSPASVAVHVSDMDDPVTIRSTNGKMA
jgi:hypothetical protein